MVRVVALKRVELRATALELRARSRACEHDAGLAQSESKLIARAVGLQKLVQGDVTVAGGDAQLELPEARGELLRGARRELGRCSRHVELVQVSETCAAVARASVEVRSAGAAHGTSSCARAGTRAAARGRCRRAAARGQRRRTAGGRRVCRRGGRGLGRKRRRSADSAAAVDAAAVDVAAAAAAVTTEAKRPALGVTAGAAAPKTRARSMLTTTKRTARAGQGGATGPTTSFDARFRSETGGETPFRIGR